MRGGLPLQTFLAGSLVASLRRNVSGLSRSPCFLDEQTLSGFKDSALMVHSRAVHEGQTPSPAK